MRANCQDRRITKEQCRNLDGKRKLVEEKKRKSKTLIWRRTWLMVYAWVNTCAWISFKCWRIAQKAHTHTVCVHALFRNQTEQPHFDLLEWFFDSGISLCEKGSTTIIHWKNGCAAIIKLYINCGYESVEPREITSLNINWKFYVWKTIFRHNSFACLYAFIDN